MAAHTGSRHAPHGEPRAQQPPRPGRPDTTPGPDVVVRAAVSADLPGLLQLEQRSFDGDRISRRSWRRLLLSPTAQVFVATSGSSPATPLLGAAVLLLRSRSSVARLYSLAVDVQARRMGVGHRLLSHALQQAVAAGAAVMSLETRDDNAAAQAMFRRHGFNQVGHRPGYYHDGAGARVFHRSLWNHAVGLRVAASRAPFHPQTLDFTCGPCALLMAMAALEPGTALTRTAEIRLWREATTVFMASGHGGCGPFGLALAACRRGFQAQVHAPDGAMFVDSVRDARKKAVIDLVESDFRAEFARSGCRSSAAPVTPGVLAAALAAGAVPVVLISLWRLHGEKGPHWVVVTGFDGHVFRILDPISDAPAGLDPGVSVSVEEFKRITRYGRRRLSAAVILSKEHPPCHPITSSL